MKELTFLSVACFSSSIVDLVLILKVYYGYPFALSFLCVEPSFKQKLYFVKFYGHVLL